MRRAAWRPFEEAREYARGLGLGSYRAWRAHVGARQLPGDVPSLPDRAYRASWRGWGDFLGQPGTSRRRRPAWAPLEEATAYARALPLPARSVRGWYAYHREHARPRHIPADPSGVYPDFPGWPEFLGHAGPPTPAPASAGGLSPALLGGEALCAALSALTRGGEPFALAAVVLRPGTLASPAQGAFSRAFPQGDPARVFHLEGELFAVLLPGTTLPGERAERARGLRARLAGAGYPQTRGAQVAVALFPHDAGAPETLLRAARGRLRGEAADRVTTPCAALLGLPEDREDVVRAGPLRLHPREHRAFQEGTEVHLTRGEFAVVLTLAQRPGQAVSRLVLSQTSRRDATTAEAALNIHITNLRAKLARAGHPDLIRTVRGVGYALRTP